MTAETARQGQQLDAAQALATLQQQQATAAKAAAQERESRLQTVRNDLQPLVAPIITASGMMRSALNAPEGFAGDSVLVRTFARQLNPTGPLSDQDVAAVANDPSIPQQIGNAIARWSKGDKLTPEERSRIKQAAAQLYRGNRDAAMTMAGPVLNTSDRLGFPRGEIFDQSALLDDESLKPFESYVPPPAPGEPSAPKPITITPEIKAAYEEYLKAYRAGGNP
jgi:hypothetical protein